MKTGKEEPDVGANCSTTRSSRKGRREIAFEEKGMGNLLHIRGSDGCLTLKGTGEYPNQKGGPPGKEKESLGSPQLCLLQNCL